MFKNCLLHEEYILFLLSLIITVLLTINMDQLFLELIGKPKLKSPKILLAVTENFSLIEDRARFLKTTLAIPLVKQLPFDSSCVKLIQIGPIHCDIKELLEKAHWTLDDYDDSLTFDQICSSIEQKYATASETRDRYLLFFNGLSLLDMKKRANNRKIVRLFDDLRRMGGHFVVGIYQNHPHINGIGSNLLLRDLSYISDAYVSTKLYKSFYYQIIWYQTTPEHHTLLPGKIDFSYYTCKIGKFYYSPDLLCFYERKKVDRTYDPDSENQKMVTGGSRDTDEEEEEEDGEGVDDALKTLTLGQKSSTNPCASSRSISGDASTTLPYTRAQDPEKSRIFYYPEKDEDSHMRDEEEDPDNDLDI